MFQSSGLDDSMREVMIDFVQSNVSSALCINFKELKFEFRTTLSVAFLILKFATELNILFHETSVRFVNTTPEHRIVFPEKVGVKNTYIEINFQTTDHRDPKNIFSYRLISVCCWENNSFEQISENDQNWNIYPTTRMKLKDFDFATQKSFWLGPILTYRNCEQE